MNFEEWWRTQGNDNAYVKEWARDAWVVAQVQCDLEAAKPEAEEAEETITRLRALIPGCDCENPAQCWEPCGTLGHSQTHAKVVRE